MAATQNQISFAYKNPLHETIGEDFFKNLPNAPAVYYFLDHRDVPLYIGKAKDLKRRLASYSAAKPGRAGDHILEMFEHAAAIRWEEHASESAALRREEELIRSVRPRFNISMNWDASYLYLGLKVGKAKKSADAPIEFNLTNLPLGREFTTYGCFRHRGKIKAGYSALLRLLYAATCGKDRFAWPAKICRTSPAYIYQTTVPVKWLEPLRQFLEGQSDELLHLILGALLARESMPKHLYHAIQRDFALAKNFYLLGPNDTFTVAQKTRSKSPQVSQDAMDKWVRKKLRKTLVESKSATKSRI